MLIKKFPYLVHAARPVGDACSDDFDNDGVSDQYDGCPNTKSITTVSFKKHMLVDLTGNSSKEPLPRWHVSRQVKILKCKLKKKFIF